MDPDRRIITDGAVEVTGAAITAVGPAAELGPADHHVPDGILLPGLIDAHQHLTGDRLVRSTIPDHIDSEAAIFDWAVPVHEHHTGDDDELSATLAAVEAACNGITTIVEAGTVAHPERVAAGLAAVGVRGTVGTWGWDVEGVPFGAPTDEVLDRQRVVLDRFPPGGLITGWVTLVGHDLMSEELLVGASALARQRGTGLTVHISPHDRDAPAWVERSGKRPLVRFDELDVLGRHVLLAHAVHLDDSEVEIILETGTAVASCPWAYLRLGQGIPHRHVELLARGGRLALGCDSENAGDQVDVLRAASLLAGLGVGAHVALEVATVRGAEAIGAVSGLAPGRPADLVVLRPDAVPAGGDPALELVWGTDGRAVRDVMVDGRWIVRDRKPTNVDLDALRRAAADARASIVRRSGLPSEPWRTRTP